MSVNFTSHLQFARTQSVVRAFGTTYLHETTEDGGDLWLTEWGWPWREHLLPERWYENGAYIKNGRRLQYSTGHVYKVCVTVGTKHLAFVTKLSRVAQRVSSSGLISSNAEPRTSFSSPFEELGQLSLLRGSDAPQRYLFTKRPLAIFSPGARVPAWMLDRIGHEFSRAVRRVDAEARQSNDTEALTLEADRDYFTLFAWVNGYNLQELVQMGRISLAEMHQIDQEVRLRLKTLGFSVADHKPDHIIVRLDPEGNPRRRNGKLVVALADFELLEAVSLESREPEKPAMVCFHDVSRAIAG